MPTEWGTAKETYWRNGCSIWESKKGAEACQVADGQREQVYTSTELWDSSSAGLGTAQKFSLPMAWEVLVGCGVRWWGEQGESWECRGWMSLQSREGKWQSGQSWPLAIYQWSYDEGLLCHDSVAFISKALWRQQMDLSPWAWLAWLSGVNAGKSVKK